MTAFPNTAHPASDALLSICLFAAFADGEKSDSERSALLKLAEELGSENVAALSRGILMRKVSLESVTAQVTDPQDKMLAYEMALGVCEAGGTVSAEEKEFLNELRNLLALPENKAETIQHEVEEVTLVAVQPPPLPATPPPVPQQQDHGGMILKYSILNGALELLPESLATMAIIPLQMKMVYRIGKSHGVELDRAHIKEFLAVAGVGLGSQILEGFARKLTRKLGRQIGGKMVGAAAGQLTGSAFSFASTYALGQLAVKYYGGGRKFDAAEAKQLFLSFKDEAQGLYDKYAPAIQDRAKTLTPGSIASLLKSPDPA